MTDEELEAAMLVPLAPAETFPDVSTCTAALAIAARQRDDSLSALAIAQQTEAGIRERLVTADERTEALRRDLADGRLTEIEAGGLAFLAKLDRDALLVELEQAENSATELLEALQGAEVAYAAAASSLTRAQTQDEFDAQAKKVGELEAELVRAVGALHSIGRRLGSPHMGQNWRVSPPLLRHFRAVACR